MRVENSNPINSNKKSDKKKTAASGFGDAMASASSSETDESSSVGGLTGIAALDGILALQEMDVDENGSQKQAYQTAMLTLGALDELRVAILMGEIPPSLLSRIERFSQSQKQYIIDPVMRSVLDEIELRAAVELAKLEMSLQGA